MRGLLSALLLFGCRSLPPADVHLSPDDSLERALESRRGRGGTILLRGGIYFLANTLVLGPEHSHLTIGAFPGEKPVLSGGTRVAFRPEGRFWVADAPGARQLFVGGERRPRARWPKKEFLHIQSLPDLKAETPWHEGQTRFRYRAGDLRAWSNLKEVEIVALHFWIESRLPVASIDEKERLVAFSKRSTFRLTADHTAQGARYFVENAFEALTEPGEWCTKEGRLYYLPRPGEEIGRVEAIVPRLARLVEITGSNITFRGIAFAHALDIGGGSGWPSADVCGAPQAAVTSPGAILVSGSKNALEGCTIAHMGSYGVEITGAENRIAGCEIFDLGAGGIKIDGPGRNVVADTRLHHGGEIFPSAVGIWIGNSGGNTIAHNHVHHFYYTGISVGWSWGYGPSEAKGNAIEYNLIHDIGQGLLSDMGGIYTLGVSPGTILRGNVIHDVESAGYGGWGIYFDEGTTGVVAEGNLVYRTKSNGFHQHYGRDNIVRNNIFAFGREAQIARSRAEGHLSFTFEGNVVFWKEGGMLSGTWEGEGYAFKGNVFWGPGAKAPPRDDGSIVADPLFADPERGDFSFRPGSPALTRGFRPVDATQAGCRSGSGVRR